MRRDAPVGEKRIVIQPHLGDLTHAEGIVVTEFGPVPVSWKATNGVLSFTFTVPAGPDGSVTLDDRTLKTKELGRWRTFETGSGNHEVTSL